MDDCANDVKFKKYLGNELTDKDIRKWDESRDQYAETVKVENVFNRCILFDGNTFHGVPCFGSKERLTQVFFVENINFSSDKSPKYPLIKSSI